MKKLLLIFIFFWGIIFGQDKIVSIELLPSQSAYEAGKSSTLIVKFKVEPTWHINAHKPYEEWAIPTELNITSSEPGISFGKVHYPKAENRKFSFSDKILNVYEGTAYLSMSLSISPEISPGNYQLEGELVFQGCNDATCLAPDEIKFNYDMEIAADGNSISYLNQDIHANFTANKTESGLPDEGSEDDLASLRDEGLLIFLLIVFVGGLALNLTPCVFPLIPITISYFGNKSEGRKSALIIHGLMYALGMAITYSLLGTFAAMAGDIIGSALQNPITIIVIVLVILALAASMFGAFEIVVPQKLAQIGGENRTGYGGTLLMGLTVGIIAAPCIGPFVLGLVTFVAQTGDWFFGFISFFFLALGLGLPYAVLAIFSSSINSLPKAGVWMIWVRKIFGFILLALAIYFMTPLIQNDLIYFILMGLTLIAGAIYLTVIDKSTGTGKSFKYIKVIIGLLFLLAGINYGLDAYNEYIHITASEDREKINWTKYSTGVIEEAKINGKPVFIDFYADWCEPCKELDRSTFRNDKFSEISADFVMVKADLTNNSDPRVNELRKKYEVRGVPTLILIDKDGSVAKSLVGFQEPEILVAAMKKIK